MRPTMAMASSLTLGMAVLACTSREVPPPASAKEAAAAWTDSSPHKVGSVQVNGVRISYLDWGGTGEGLVFIHGLGDSPHVWDDLAPAFTGQYRVVAYARRGHGRSGDAGPYDNATLTEDLHQLLDSLGIKRASLAGWSMAGNEITEFAIRYPERTHKLVYFDAGYDWSDPRVAKAFEKIPLAFSPDSAATRSFEAFRSWYKEGFWPDVTWTPAMEAEVRDIADVQTDGTVRYRQSDSLTGVLFASLMSYRRDYARVKAPALGLFVERFLSEQRADSGARGAVKAWNDSLWTPFAADARRRFQRELRDSRVVVLPGTSHPSLPFQARDSMLAELHRFLGPAAKP